MKVDSLSIAIVFAGKYQNYKNLTLEEREARRIICEAKSEKTKSAFPIANGSWVYENLGLQRSKILPQTTCANKFTFSQQIVMIFLLPKYDDSWLRFRSKSLNNMHKSNQNDHELFDAPLFERNSRKLKNHKQKFHLTYIKFYLFKPPPSKWSTASTSDTSEVLLSFWKARFRKGFDSFWNSQTSNLDELADLPLMQKTVSESNNL